MRGCPSSLSAFLISPRLFLTSGSCCYYTTVYKAQSLFRSKIYLNIAAWRKSTYHTQFGLAFCEIPPTG